MADPETIPQGGEHDIVIPQGRNFATTFLLRQPGGVDVADLAGYSAQSEMRTRNGALLLTFTTAIDVPTGAVTISATPAETALVDKSGVYDVQLTQPGEELLIVGGVASLRKEVTKA